MGWPDLQPVHSPYKAVHGPSEDDVVSEGNQTVHRHGMAREPVADVAPASPREHVQLSVTTATNHLLTTLQTQQQQTAYSNRYSDFNFKANYLTTYKNVYFETGNYGIHGRGQDF